MLFRRLNIFIILYLSLVLFGCQTETAIQESTNLESSSVSTETQSSSPSINDPAEYEFHRNKAFTDVTKEMPDSSVDHMDLDMATDPNVIVVVTVNVPYKEGIRFTTTFAGSNNLIIEKEWAPAAGGEHDDQHLGLFILPAAVESGTTVVH
ncbi:MAG: hypothetical protein COA78_20185 [Blastopirellula sp.]|nr:MAG: hypothetical protein COA78_20185 [Blastopirellula sp.]